jgi:uncharacterized protein DUF11
MKTKLKIILALPLILLVLETTALADSVGWHPQFGGDIGRGLDLKNETTTKPPVAIFDTTHIPPYTGTGQQSISVVFSQTTLDMASSFSLNSDISLYDTVFSGSIGFSFADQQSFSQNTLNFVYDSTRDFGNTSLTFLGLDPNFTNVVNGLKQTLSGDALQQAITSLYGTHVIYGYQSSARVVVDYQFQYSSASIARQTSLSIQANYSSGFDGGSFNAFVQSQFAQTNTGVSLNVRFWSSDPTFPPTFPIATNLTSYNDFIAYVGQVQAYSAAMNSLNAKKMGYLIEPLQSLPGYLSLIDGYNPTNLFNTSYDEFLQVYSRLKGWENTLLSWTLDNNHMSWMNTNAQQQVIAIRGEVTSQRQYLEQLFTAHVETGAALQLPDSIINYFVNFNRIPLPKVNTADIFNYYRPNYYYLIGYIDCGPTNMTVDTPFLNVLAYRNGIPAPPYSTIYWSATNFESLLISHEGGSYSDYNSSITAFLASPTWMALKQNSAGEKLGFFEWYDVNDDLTLYSLGIEDATGSLVDQMDANSGTAAFSSVKLEASPQVSLQGGAVPASTNFSTAGLNTTYTLAVTNNGPGAAYGINVSFPLANTNKFDFVSVSGSQGQGTYTNGNVLYHLGPLGNGQSATINLAVVPVVTGLFLPTGQGSLTLGAGLTDPSPTNDLVNLNAISFQSPTISIASRSNNTELKWYSDTSRIFVEQANDLSGGTWTPVAGSITTNGSQHQIDLGSSGTKKFFRLHGN